MGKLYFKSVIVVGLVTVLIAGCTDAGEQDDEVEDNAETESASETGPPSNSDSDSDGSGTGAEDSESDGVSDSDSNGDTAQPETDDTDVSTDIALYLDVRTEGEYAAGHYPGALNIPLDSLIERQDEIYPKDRWIIVYCASGYRSAQAKILLEQEGFSNVEDGGALGELTFLSPTGPSPPSARRIASAATWSRGLP